MISGKSSAVTEASRPDIRRCLRLTFEDDLFLPRYHEPIAIQPEPESVTTHSRRDAIIRAATVIQPPSFSSPGTGSPSPATGSPSPSFSYAEDPTQERSNSPLPFPVDGMSSPPTGTLPPKISSPPLLLRGRAEAASSKSKAFTVNLPPTLTVDQSSAGRPPAVSPQRRNNSSGKPPLPVFLQTPPQNRSGILISAQMTPQGGMDALAGSPSFMAQPLEGSAVGRPRSMSTIRGPSPLTLFKPQSNDHTPVSSGQSSSSGTPLAASQSNSANNLLNGVSSPRKREDLSTSITLGQTPGSRLAGDSRQSPQQNQAKKGQAQGSQQQPTNATPLSAQRTMTQLKQQLPIQSTSPGEEQPRLFSEAHYKALQEDADNTTSAYHATPRPRKKGVGPLRLSQPLSTPVERTDQPMSSGRHHRRKSSTPFGIPIRCSGNSDDYDIGSPCSPIVSPTGDVFNPSFMFKPITRQTRSASSGFDTMTSSFSWNERFIEAIENIGKLTHSSHADERLSAYENLSRLAGDFNDTVRKYARIIISEVYLPACQKTIKPSHVGGIVGGEKYIVHGIMFKFAMDSKKMYGGDEHAAKVAGHELKGLVHLYNCWERGIHFPMMTIVDYRGFRIVGMPMLPIKGTETLVYGSNDAGKTIKTCPFLEERLKSIGEKLNLKPHLVGQQDNLLFYTPVDLEGHYGSDGRYYLLDFSRLFPPQSLNPAHKMGHLYQLFRPEFVRMYEKPLCSDALSSFICPNHRLKSRRDMAEEHDDEIEEATDYLTGTVVQAFAQRLTRLSSAQRDEFQLIMLLHESGINCRLLGLVYSYIAEYKDEYWCARLLIQMAARVIKSEVNALLRRKVLEVSHPGECEYRTAVVAYLNLVLGDSVSSENHWKESIAEGMKVKFPGFGETALGNNTEFIRGYIFSTPPRLGYLDGRCLLLREVSRMLGLQFSTSAWDHLARTGSAYDKVSPITNTDLEELHEIVKEMHIASHSSAFVLKMKAMLVSQEEERRRLLDLAVQQFNRALEGNPDNKVTLRNLGDCLILLDRVDAALNTYMRCLSADPEDPNTLYKFAIVLDKMGALDAAEEYYLRSLEFFPFHSNCCFAYADFLCYQRKNFSEAERFYLKAVEVDESNHDACNNYAIFLVTVKRDYSRAEYFFKKAVDGAPQNVTYIKNYASFLLHIRRNVRDADIYADRAKALSNNSNNYDTWDAPSPNMRHNLNEIITAFADGTVPHNLTEF